MAKNLLSRRIAGKLAREKRKGIEIEITKAPIKQVDISKKELKGLSSVIKQVLRRDGAELSRARKNKRIQAFILTEQEILDEISHPLSPFMYPEDPGQTELKRLAKIISNDLWKLFNTKVNVNSIYRTGQEETFAKDPNPAALFDNTIRVMYIHGQKGSDNFEVLRASSKLVKNFLETSRPPTDPTRVFYTPHPEFIREKILLDRALQDEADQKFGSSPSGEKKSFLSNARQRRQEYKDLKGKYPFNVEGSNLGHTFGASVSVATNLLDDRKLISEQNLSDIKLSNKIPAELQAELKPLIINIVNADAKVKYERTIRKNNVIGEIAIIAPELDKKNKIEGTAAKKVLDEIRKVILSFINKIPDIEGSPSYNQLLSEYVESLFISGKPPKNKKYTGTVKIPREKFKVPIGTAKLRGSRAKIEASTKSRAKSSGPTLKDLIILINSRLEEYIREDMGKGSAEQRLNWRTGRFGKSATVEDLNIRGKRTLEATVRYHGYPYTTFEKGGQLYKPLRDPKGIFGRSIRRILQDEKIAQLSRVPVRLNREN